MTMTDQPMVIASLTITKTLEPSDDVAIAVAWEPDDLALIDRLGMLAFATAALTAEMHRYDDLED